MNSFVSLLFIIVSLFSAVFPLDIYVSPTGSDSNSGLASNTPFATFQKAIDKYRQIKAANADVVIQLSSGNYRLTSTLTLSSSDNPIGSLTIKGTGSTKPNILGSVSLTGNWKELGRNNIWYLDNINTIIQTATGASPSSTPYNNLYVNDRRAIRARNPNQGRSNYHYAKNEKENTSHTLLQLLEINCK